MGSKLLHYVINERQEFINILGTSTQLETLTKKYIVKITFSLDQKKSLVYSYPTILIWHSDSNTKVKVQKCVVELSLIF